MSIYDMHEILKIPLLHSLTQQNITSGFAVAGISPFHRDVFSDADFAPSYVTDRPAPQFNAAIGTIYQLNVRCSSNNSGSFVMPSFSFYL